MRILITGGFGFVGGRLAQHLQQAGHQIVLGSRKARSSPDWLPQAEVVQTDWKDGRVLEQICNGIDVVIQAAGMNAQDCVADIVAALEINGVATARLLKAAITQGVKRFIYLSTAHVYSSPLVDIINEDTCPRNLHPYATSHLAGENVILSAGQRGKIEGFVLRLSNIFGPPTHKDVNCWMLLVNDLCRQAVQTRKLVLRSSGLQQRDFFPMSDVCRVIQHIASFDSMLYQPNVFNVGAGISQSVLGMARLIQQRGKLVLGFEPELQCPDTGTDGCPEIMDYRVDRLEATGFNPTHDNSSEIDGLLSFCNVSFDQKQDGSV